MSDPNWLWPVDNSSHTLSCSNGCAFDDPRSYAGNHEGVDLKADFMDPILASRDGVVSWASIRRRSTGAMSAYGWHVVLDHGDSWVTWYCHMNNLEVKEGDVVQRGDVVGLAGSTGNSSGVHLHFNVQKIGGGLSGYILKDVVNPEPLLGL